MRYILHIAGGRFELAASEGDAADIQRRLTFAAEADQEFALVGGGDRDHPHLGKGALGARGRGQGIERLHSFRRTLEARARE